MNLLTNHGYLQLAPTRLFAALLILSGCLAPIPPSPSLNGSPAAVSDSESDRAAAAEATARRDLACDRVAIVARMDRRYANRTSLRYVVEGCGQRATYLEDCSDYTSCVYLIVANLRFAQPTARDPVEAK